MRQSSGMIAGGLIGTSSLPSHALIGGWVAPAPFGTDFFPPATVTVQAFGTMRWFAQLPLASGPSRTLVCRGIHPITTSMGALPSTARAGARAVRDQLVRDGEA